MLRKKVVYAVYRALLNREPESPAVIKYQQEAHKTLDSLISAVLMSPEFMFNEGRVRIDKLGMSNGKIDVIADNSQLMQLFERTARQWTALGEQDPYWSVLSDDKYRKRNFDQYSTEFWDSGVYVLD
jgi:hypothetical protein